MLDTHIFIIYLYTMSKAIIDLQVSKTKQSICLFILSVVSESLQVARFAHVEYFGILSVLKCLVDLPKEYLRNMAILG